MIKFLPLFLFCILLSVVYLLKIPYSPAYIGQFFCIILLLYKLFYIDRKLSVPLDAILSLFIILPICTTFLTATNEPGVFINALFTFLIYFLIRSCNFDKEDTIKISKYLVYFIMIIVVFETIYRLSNPLYYGVASKDSEDIFFYPFKRNSLMFLDSNYTAILILTSLQFFLFDLISVKKHKLSLIMLIILLFLTFSRASIITFLLLVVIKFFINNRNKVSIQVFTLLAPILFIVTWVVYGGNINFNDGSFQSKFVIIDKVVYLLSNFEIENVFGLGMGGAKSILGIGAHNIFVLSIVEFGLFFSLVLLTFMLSIMISNFKYGLLFVSMFLVNGFSLGFFFPFVLIPIALRLNYGE